MNVQVLQNYALDQWFTAAGGFAEAVSAIDGAPVARVSSAGLDFAAMARHARETGGPALRALTFHQRAKMLKGLAEAILARKEELYALSAFTGATRRDGWVDIEAGRDVF